ncbi:phosphatase PAP2 family protein [Streptococcus phocae subsp. salmonis]
MKNKQQHMLKSSFALLLFVIMGYMVKFFPEQLTALDGVIQSAVRGNLPEGATRFFKLVTIVGNVKTQMMILTISVLICYALKWKAEALFLLSNGLMAALFITGFKILYQRPRPLIEHLVHAGGYSFPSGHTTGSMLIIGSLIIIFHQRLRQSPFQLVVDFCLTSLLLLIGLSRVYLGVHYPSDVLAGFLLGFGILSLLYPYYDKKRFEWRFHLKQH